MMAEASIAIVVACCLLMRPIFEKMIPRQLLLLTPLQVVINQQGSFRHTESLHETPGAIELARRPRSPYPAEVSDSDDWEDIDDSRVTELSGGVTQ
jgi:hypothetical protein